MATNPFCASTLPWIWVIETLARFKQVDASLLIDLVKRTPEISDDLGKNAREMVSFRILESFFVQGSGITTDVASAPDSKIGFDLSEHCEDVLRRILHETSGSNLRMPESEMLKWDIESFIMHKRSCLPKCALQQLKDAILESSHPLLASLKEKSGLVITNQFENGIPLDGGVSNGVAQRFEGSGIDDQTIAAKGTLISPIPENGDDSFQENVTDINLLPAKRVRNGSASENHGGRSHKNGDSVDNGCHPLSNATKKLKQDAICTRQAVGQNLNCIRGTGLVEDSFGRIVQQTGREGCDLSKEPQVRGLKESRFPEDGHDVYSASERLGLSCDVGHAKFLRGQEPFPCDDDKVLQETSGGGEGQIQCVDEAKEDSEGCAELRRLNGATQGVTLQKHSVDEAIDNCEHSFQPNVSNGAPPGEAEDDMEHNCEPKKSSDCDGYHDERTDIATKKHTQGVTQQNISVDGAKDNCGHSFQPNASNGAPSREAKDDMEPNREPEMSSDSDGPHDERTDIATKKHAFLSSQCTYKQDSLATTDWTELNLCMKCNKGGQLLVCNSDACPLAVHESCLGSAATFDVRGNFYCPFCAYSRVISEYLDVKKKASLARNDLAAFIRLGIENRPKFSKNLHRSEQNQSRQEEDLDGNNEANSNQSYVNKVNDTRYRENTEDMQQAEASVSCVNDDLPCELKGPAITNETHCVLTEGKHEGQKMGQECQSLSGLEEQQIAGQAVHNCEGDQSSCRDTVIVHECEGHAEIEMQHGVLHQPITGLPHEPLCPPSTDADGSSEEENDKSIASKYSIRFRKREMQYTNLPMPQLRRKKLAWTKVEEETLKEGVRRFSSVHDRSIPWKMILEFGINMFHKGRTTIDLKDKWRNICKGSPKSK